MEQRYARQEVLGGWDQERLARATVAIAGSGPMAFLCGLMATAMGFGRLVLLGRGTGGGFRLPQAAGDSGAAAPFTGWVELYGRLNPRVRVYPCPVPLRGDLGQRLPALDGLIVAGNDLRARLAGRRIAQQCGVPVVAGGCAGHLGVWGAPVADPAAVHLHGRAEAPLLGQIVAALLVEDMRKTLLPLPGEEGPTDRANRVCLPPPQTPGHARPVSSSLHWRGLALVGAGALGTWFGLGLGLARVPAALSIFDADQVEETNLNRQILFYESVGQSKAIVLARRLQELFPWLKVAGYGMRVGEETSKHLQSAAVVAACPDNHAARVFLNGLAKRHHRVLLSGGTSASGGSCLLYEPGTTACLSCRLRIDQLAEREEAPQSCARQAQPSIVTSNAMIGALMAWLLHDRLSTGRAEAGMWEYDGRPQHTRLSLHPEWPACRCHHPARR